MKFSSGIFCCLSALFISGCSPVMPEAQARTVKVFFIGNSFSQNATRFLPQLVKEGEHEIVLGRAEVGGAPLQYHWEAAEAAEANPNDPKGKPYNGKSLRTLLSEGNWDYVSIQQGSFVSSAIATYQPYAEKLRDYIKGIQPNTEVVLHQTWAYRADAKKFGAVRPNHLAATQKEMWEESRAAYHKTADELKLRLVPTGDAFYKVDSDPAWGYKKDANFDFENPVQPNMPMQKNSLHQGYSWQKDAKGVVTLALDANHAGDAGCYLAGAVWYSFLFNESPEKLKFKPNTLSEDFAAYLRKTAWQTVQQEAK